MPDVSPAFASRLREVLERIARAADRAGRPAGSVRLVGATKGVPAARVAEAARAGLGEVGENRVQEMVAKRDALAGEADASALRWHFIGAVQRNKAQALAGRVALVHGVGSVAVAAAIGAAAARAGVVQPVLVEVNAGGEPTKHGVDPADLPGTLDRIAGTPGLAVYGLMTVAPRGEREARAAFRALAALSERLIARHPQAADLSMGMSDDFEIAIEEGATIVRVGTALFGSRDP